MSPSVHEDLVLNRLCLKVHSTLTHLDAQMTQKISVIDSHTGGEPTRLIFAGGPDLGKGNLSERRTIFQNQFDHLRSAVVNEPRGSDVLVGGLVCEPVDSKNSCGVIFFNAKGFLGMCGHGTIGLMVTLAHLGRIKPGKHHIETPVGIVDAELEPGGRVRVRNVTSYRLNKDVEVHVSDYGTVTGDIAWGGNWFFLVKETSEILQIGNTYHLMQITNRIRTALLKQGHTGIDGAEVDHLELFSDPRNPENHSRNFVLCPGNAYDRSPCGTGMSAKLACLAADGQLAPGEIWRQESILGSVFECSFEWDKNAPQPNAVLPTICGSAHVTSEATLLLNSEDPFCMGIRNEQED